MCAYDGRHDVHALMAEFARRNRNAHQTTQTTQNTRTSKCKVRYGAVRQRHHVDSLRIYAPAFRRPERCCGSARPGDSEWQW